MNQDVTKVLLTIDSLGRGGRERRMIELVKGLQKYSQELTCEIAVFSSHVAYPEVFNLGIPVHILGKSSTDFLSLRRNFRKVLKDFNPHIIHNWGYRSSLYILPVVWSEKYRLISALIADAPNKVNITNKNYLRLMLSYPVSDLILANSKAGLKAYNVPARKGICIYNGFDFNRVLDLKDESEIRHEFGIESPIIVGMVGAFADRKDYHTFIKAGLRIVEQREDVIFLAVGDGKNLNRMKELVPVKYKERIIFTGQQLNVESIINLFTIGVLMTSPDIHGEGISNAILEYMALNKPVIASRGGGTSEIVVHNDTGFLIEPRSIEELVKKLNFLLEHPEKVSQMGEKGKLRINELFELNRVTMQYVETYRKLRSNINKRQKSLT